MQIIAISTIYAILPVITSLFPTTLIFVKTERSPNRNPVFPQFPRLPLYKEIQQIPTKFLQKLRPMRMKPTNIRRKLGRLLQSTGERVHPRPQEAGWEARTTPPAGNRMGSADDPARRNAECGAEEVVRRKPGALKRRYGQRGQKEIIQKITSCG